MTRTRIIIISLLMVSLLTGCEESLRESKLFDRESGMAAVCTLTGDTTVVAIKDYFHNLSRVDKVVSPNFTIEPMGGSFDSVRVIRHSSSLFLSSMRVYCGNEYGSIVLRDEGQSGDGVPSITTVGLDASGHVFTVKVENSPAVYLMQWQNTLLSSKSISYKGEGEFLVKVPAVAQKMERSFLRISSANRNGVGNDITVPLVNGKVVMDASLVNSKTEECDTLCPIRQFCNESMPLLYGSYYVLVDEDDFMAYMRVYMGDYVIVAINDSTDKVLKTVTLPFGLKYKKSSSLGLLVDPESRLILTPDSVI